MRNARNTTIHAGNVAMNEHAALALKVGRGSWLIAGVTVLQETDKAIKVGSNSSKITLWFPKAALIATDREPDATTGKFHKFDVAPWFINNVSAEQYKFIRLFFEKEDCFVSA